MTRDMKVLNIFVASPGGVADERDAVEAVAGRINSSVGRIHGAAVTVRRYEQLVGGAGNPQAQINAHADDADIFIGIVHRRWGSDTGNGFDSGFHEEFTRALRRWESSGAPRIALFFKAVDRESLDDPGEQLTKVLEFQRRIEVDHTAFYNRFSSPAELELMVTSLVVEELARVAQQNQATVGDGATSNDPPLTEPPQEREPISVELAAVVSAFADALAGREVAVSLDIDRLELLALAVSRDSDRVPVHLANRLYSRREEVHLIPVERRIWFREYVRDIGRSSDEQSRVIPFAAVAGEDWIRDALGESAAEMLREGNAHLQIGTIRLLTRLRMRPRSLWPKAARPGFASELSEIWSGVAESAKVEMIRYWLSVRRRRDTQRARVLASSPEPLGSTGRAISDLLAATPKADGIIDVDVALLLDPLVRSCFADGTPERTLSTEVLAKLVERSYLSDEVRALSLEELARRDEVPETVVNGVLNSTSSSRWGRVVDRVLLDREVGPIFIQSLLSALQAPASGSDENARRRRTGDAVAMLSRRNNVVDSVLSSLLDPVKHFDENVLRWQLIRSAGDPTRRSVARGILNRSDARYRSWLAMLDAAGWEESTKKFVQDRIDLAVMDYLLSLQDPKSDALAVKSARELASDSSSLFRHDAMELLAVVANDQDIDLILSNIYAFDNPTRALLRVIERASLKRLRVLALGDDERPAALAMDELARRGRPLPAGQLKRLMRSALSKVRMQAFEQLARGYNHDELAALCAEYVRGKGTHYYNVVCAIDARLAGLPIDEPAVKGSTPSGLPG